MNSKGRKAGLVAASVLAGIAVWAPLASATTPEGGGRTTEGGSRMTEGGSRETEGGDRTTDSGSDGRDRSSNTTCNFNSINTTPNTVGGPSIGNVVLNSPYNAGNVGNHASCTPG